MSGSGDGSDPAAVFSFLIMALISGMATSKLLDHCNVLPYTVCLFIEGATLGFIHYRGVDLGSLSTSIDMWVKMDPHVLLYTFLPCLLFGDTSILIPEYVKGCLAQCLLLAGPGVIFGTYATGAFAYRVLPYGWNWDTCVCFGSILAATDPVAVTGILRELGASKVLTMQITGESLLNDGMAIVLWSIAADLMKGKTYGIGDVLGKFVRLAGGGWTIGVVVGVCSILAIISCSAELKEHDRVLQLSATLVCAYASFYMSEHELHCSGVLATVAAALVIARMGWQQMLDRHGIETVWHMMEFVGNTLIFFQAGTIFGEVISVHRGHPKPADIGWLLLTYVACMFIRGAMIMLFYPVLRRVGFSTNWKDALVMWWGGLRGAVGLALAMVIDNYAHSSGDEVMGTLFMFHIGGVAALTLVINASTAGALLNALGMVNNDWARDELVSTFKTQMYQKTRIAYGKLSLTPKFIGHDRELIQMWITPLREDPGHVQAVLRQSMRECAEGKNSVPKARSSLFENQETDESEGAVQALMAQAARASSVEAQGRPLLAPEDSGEVPEVTVEPECSPSPTAIGAQEVTTEGTSPSPKAKCFHRLSKASEEDQDPDAEILIADPTKMMKHAMEHGRAKSDSVTDISGNLQQFHSETHKELVKNLMRLDTARWGPEHASGSNVAAMMLMAVERNYAKQGGAQGCVEQAISSVRILFYSMLRAHYWEQIEEGSLPRNSRATTTLLAVVDTGEAFSHKPIHDVVHLLRSYSFATTWYCKPPPTLARFLRHINDATITGQYYVPVRRGNAIFDLHGAVCVIDAHRVVQQSIKGFHFDSTTLMKETVKVVVEESDAQIRLLKKFLYVNRVSLGLLALVRTQQLAQALLHEAESRVHQLVQAGALHKQEAELLLEESQVDSVNVWAQGSVHPGDGENWWHAVDADLPLEVPSEVWNDSKFDTAQGVHRKAMYDQRTNTNMRTSIFTGRRTTTAKGAQLGKSLSPQLWLDTE